MDLDDSMYSCLTFDSVKVEAYDSVNKAFSFYKSFLERLKQLKCRDVRLELYSWPRILKNISITCVSTPKSYKSKEFQSEKQDIKIGAILLCSSYRQTYEIARQAKQWRDPNVPPMEQTLRIVSMNSTNANKSFTQLF